MRIPPEVGKTMINQVEIRKKLANTHGKNASLWLNKYLQDYTRDESRKELIEEAARIPEPPEYTAYFERWRETLTNGYGAQTRCAQVKGRMIVGLGSESVLETSICLHRIYGVPYIPGSALKGLAASYAHQRLGDEWQKGGTFHNIVFGNTDDAGYITFFDALYQPGTGWRKQALYPDVITVHHQKYYQDAGKPPTDSDDPNPVPFLSATGSYLLALAAPDFQQPTRWVDITFQILAEALEQFGIGAKTSSGYGRLELLDSPMRSLNPALKSQGHLQPVQGPHALNERIRAKSAQLRAGQEIKGSVIPLTDELRSRIPPDITAVLSYESFPTTEVLIALTAEEAAAWKPGEMRICIFEREAVHNGLTIWLCKPRVKKDKKK